MKTQEKIISALTRIREISRTNQANVIRSNQMLRADRELLVQNKWLQEIIKGWYLLVKPEALPGDSFTWYASLWDFLRIYLEYHYKDQYCLSAENSLDLHTGSTIIPKQIIVISSKGGGSSLTLPFNTALFVYADSNNLPEEKEILRGVHVMTLPLAICKVSEAFFQKNAEEAKIALQLIRSPSELTSILYKYNFKSAASRLLGAYSVLGNPEMANSLKEELHGLGWKIKEESPFYPSKPIEPLRKILSPYAARIFSMWSGFREKVIPYFPPSLGMPKKPDSYFEHLEEIYERDAYNSLSIEGYIVDEDLIAKVQNNNWNPDKDFRDREERNALAARGYYEAFLEVKKTLHHLLQGNNSGDVIEKDLKKWYQCLFGPMTRAGILRKEDLIGYRKSQVFIRNSRHLPPPKEALLDAMDALFTCLKEEPEASVRAVLGHYIFVYIHPFMDGNGRIGRFLMNTLFFSGGYPWTIVQVKNRKAYIDALELAGVELNIESFVAFIAQEMQVK